MILEDDLRAALREHAAEPALRPDLLDEVRGGIRRADRRRAAVLGAAVVLAAVTAVPVVIAGGRPSGPVPVGSAPAGPTTGWHQRPRFDLPLFSLSPAWTPAGRVGRAGPNLLLSYGDPADRALALSVGPEPGD